MSKRVHITVHGRVQNVGFRQFTARRASGLALSGWVRNLPDQRTVEIEAEGEESAVDALEAAVCRGPGGARVASMHLDVIPPIGGAGGFRVAD